MPRSDDVHQSQQMAGLDMVQALPFIKEGRLRALMQGAMTNEARLELVENIGGSRMTAMQLELEDVPMPGR